MKYIITALCIGLMASCGSENKKGRITSTDAIDTYIKNNTTHSDSALAFANSEIEFWSKKLNAHQDNFVYQQALAGAHSLRFEVSHDIKDIVITDSLLQLANTKTKSSRAGLLRTLSRHQIKQHEFGHAYYFAEKALRNGENRYGSNLLMFDVLMELGDVELAKAHLFQLENKNNFDYYIRLSKLKDHEGDLDSAIIYMEWAAQKVQGKNLEDWAQSNLADMYGHAGRVEESYNTYVKVLDRTPSYSYALKGIAWVAYAHDHDIKTARKIFKHLATITKAPDYYLQLAELAAYEGNEAEAFKYKKQFQNAVNHPEFKGMYNKYLLDILIDVDPDAAYKICEEEIEKRPTAVVYSWLARVELAKGNNKKALSIIQTKVENQTFEPDALYVMGLVYRAVGDSGKATKCFNEVLESSYEIGPLLTEEVKSNLNFKS